MPTIVSATRVMSATKWASTFAAFVLFGLAILQLRINRPGLNQSVIVTCPRNITPLTDVFQLVDPANHMYVYSAYTDTIDGTPFVRILGLALFRRIKEPLLTCSIRYAEGECFDVPAYIVDTEENHSEKYTSVFILCEYHNMTPISVSLKMEPFTHRQYNNLAIHTYRGRIQRQFTHCLAPLQGQFNHAKQLIEFFAVNQEFGTEKFIIYTNSISQNIKEILRIFSDAGLVEVIEWKLPFDSSDIHYYGQMLSMNDCLYRNRHKTRFIINSDLDEFIVPRTTRKWAPLLDSLLEQNPRLGVFNVRSYVFGTFLPNHPADFPQRKTAEKFNSMTLLKTNRTVLPLPPDVRSKYIYDPSTVAVVGTHFVWSVRNSAEVIYIEPNICSLNHYREAMLITFIPGIEHSFTTDTYMHNFQDDIVGKMNDMWSMVENVRR